MAKTDGIQTWIRKNPGSYESIRSYRSFSDYKKRKHKYNDGICDVSVTAYVPILFKVQTRTKRIKVKVPIKNTWTWRGKKYSRYTYRWVRRYVDVPYYVFHKRSLKLSEWAEILRFSKAIYHDVLRPIDHNNVISIRIKWLENVIYSYGLKAKARCVKKANSRNVVHEVKHQKVLYEGPDTLDLSINGWMYHPLANTQLYNIAGSKVVSPLLNQSQSGRFRDYERALNRFHHDCVDYTRSYEEGMLNWLWPSAQDMAELIDKKASRSQVMVAVAEALADGAVIGSIPDPTLIIRKHRKWFDRLLGVIDFAANAWLFKSLVITPLIGELVSLSMLSEYMDNIATGTLKLAAKDGWVQGKTRPYYKWIPRAISAPDSFIHQAGNAFVHGSIYDTIKYPKVKSYGQLYFKVNNAQALYDSYTTMGRVGKAMASLTSTASTIVWELIPFSFVFDYFNSSVARRANFLNKTLVPLGDYMLVSSVLTQKTVQRRYKAHIGPLYLYDTAELVKYPKDGVEISECLRWRSNAHFGSEPYIAASSDPNVCVKNLDVKRSRYDLKAFQEDKNYERWISKPRFNQDAEMPPDNFHKVKHDKQKVTVAALVWTIFLR